ncbi:hypothetical protein RZN22_17400 [Bacillaceae bacterium S4-13-58]
MPRKPLSSNVSFQQSKPRRNQNVFYYFKRDEFANNLHMIDYSARQAMKVYSQVAPYLSKFLGR